MKKLDCPPSGKSTNICMHHRIVGVIYLSIGTNNQLIGINRTSIIPWSIYIARLSDYRIPTMNNTSGFPMITVRNSSCRKVMFSQRCVKNSVHSGKGKGGIHGQVRGVHGGGHAWHVGDHVWWGGMQGRGCVAEGVWMATAANGTHPAGKHSCSVIRHQPSLATCPKTGK